MDDRQQHQQHQQQQGKYEDQPGVQLLQELIDALKQNTEANLRLGEILDDSARESHALIMEMRDQKEDNGVLSSYMYMFHDLVETVSSQVHRFRDMKDAFREARDFYRRYAEESSDD